MSDYIVTRWYRAPEILLGSSVYGPAADMWALGCVFAEMITGNVLFQGSSTLNQLEIITSLIGVPT
jgi:mitogen-activated protein kinase 15